MELSCRPVMPGTPLALLNETAVISTAGPPRSLPVLLLVRGGVSRCSSRGLPRPLLLLRSALRPLLSVTWATGLGATGSRLCLDAVDAL